MFGGAASEDSACHTQSIVSFVECSVSVVYRIPFTCGVVYDAAMVRCLNTRLREHSSFFSAIPSGHRAQHVRDCGGTPFFHNIFCSSIKIKGQSKN